MKENTATCILTMFGGSVLAFGVGSTLLTASDQIDALRVENAKLRTTISQYKPATPSDSQCIAWLFQTDLNAARDRVCGRKRQ